MADVMNTPFGDIDVSAVEAAVSGAGGPEREPVEEITLKFAKGLCSEPFTSKAGKEYVRIQIPNADPSDHSPWQEFVLGSNQVHENQYGKGLWAKLPAEGHTTVSRPFLAGQDENGRNVWKADRREVPNRELKEMVEFYKTRGRDERHSASEGRQAQGQPAQNPQAQEQLPQNRQTQEKTGRSREGSAQKAEPEQEAERADGKAPPGERSSVKDQLAAGKKEAAKTRSPKAKTDRKLNKEPEL